MAGETTGQYIQVITTIDSEERARAIARLAVESRLGACAQVYGPVSSVYRWQGAIDEAAEWACVVKTLAVNYDALAHLIKVNHTYSVPELLAVPVVAGSTEYLNWVRENSTPGDAGTAAS